MDGPNSRSSRVRLVVLTLAVGMGLGCRAARDPIGLVALELEPGDARFRVDLPLGYLPGSLAVYFDDERIPIERLGLHGPFVSRALQVAPSGRSGALMLEARFVDGLGIATRRKILNFRVPADTADLAASWPERGTQGLPRADWIQLMFESSPSDETLDSLSLACGGRDVAFARHRIDGRFFVLNPSGELPAATHCMLHWSGRDGEERLYFSTARAGDRAEVLYSREDDRIAAPFPDDFWTRRAPVSRTHRRVQLPPAQGESGLEGLVRALRSEVDVLDGFSPVGHLVVEVSDRVDPSSVPLDTSESLHPASSIVLLDVDPKSPDFGRRVPFETRVRTTPEPPEGTGHSLLVLEPTLPLRPGGRYGLIVTRAVRVDPRRPLEPSAFMQAVLSRSGADDSKRVRQVRLTLAPLLWVAEVVAHPPIPSDDVALATIFTVGTLHRLTRDLEVVRREVFDAPPPRFRIDRVEARESPESPVVAIVHGVWQAPDFRPQDNFLRSPAGSPWWRGTEPVPFTLALPRRSVVESAPVVIYRHGNPGSAEAEVPAEARRTLAEAGFAVIGFTDVFNRDEEEPLAGRPVVSSQWVGIARALLRNDRVPEPWLQTHAEQIAFLRLIDALNALDVLPLPGGDGVPDLDVDAPFGYLGMSEGASLAPAFLVFAPEVRAAALVAGGAPIARMLEHQLTGSVLETFATAFMNGNVADVLVGLSLFQAAIDRQDAYNFARRLYREPLAIDAEARKASILMIGGVEDQHVPNASTDALAWVLGPIPLLEPAPRSVPFLERVTGPVQANVDFQTSAAYHQIVPIGVPGVEATPGCREGALPDFVRRDGHYCAQHAAESIQLRRAFFESALRERAPIIEAPSWRSVE